jgi:uncharacterized membrane protein
MPLLVDELTRVEGLRQPATWIVQFGAGPPRRWARRLQNWLGHPAHPAFTDLPIGFWTSSLVVDLIGGKRGARVSRRLVGLGVLTALPTAVIGLGDAVPLSNARRRVAAVHAVCNVLATFVYVMSWWSRRGDRRLVGALLGLAGAGLATTGGLLGGHLVFGPDELAQTEPVPGEDLSEQLIDVELDRRRAAHESAARRGNGPEFQGL